MSKERSGNLFIMIYVNERGAKIKKMMSVQYPDSYLSMVEMSL